MNFCFASAFVSSGFGFVVVYSVDSCFFICFLSVVSLVWHISIARDKVSFQSCNKFFSVVFPLIPMTNRSRLRELSCKQAQKLHGCARVRRAVTYWSTVSFSFFCRLLNMNRSYISFVSPKHSSLNLFTTVSNLVRSSAEEKSMPSKISRASSPTQERKVAVLKLFSKLLSLATLA